MPYILIIYHCCLVQSILDALDGSLGTAVVFCNLFKTFDEGKSEMYKRVLGYLLLLSNKLKRGNLLFSSDFFVSLRHCFDFVVYKNI